jgi:hypothetical protein
MGVRILVILVACGLLGGCAALGNAKTASAQRLPAADYRICPSLGPGCTATNVLDKPIGMNLATQRSRFRQAINIGTPRPATLGRCHRHGRRGRRDLPLQALLQGQPRPAAATTGHRQLLPRCDRRSRPEALARQDGLHPRHRQRPSHRVVRGRRQGPAASFAARALASSSARKPQLAALAGAFWRAWPQILLSLVQGSWPAPID